MLMVLPAGAAGWPSDLVLLTLLLLLLLQLLGRGLMQLQMAHQQVMRACRALWGFESLLLSGCLLLHRSVLLH